MTHQEAEAILEEAAAKLGEHFDAVQILATFQNDHASTCFTPRGVGNFYARLGMAKAFVDRDEAYENAEQIAQKLKSEEP